MTEDLISIMNAIGRKITMMEFKNIWDYKYCFKVTTNDNGKNLF
jgi:hypothetical protein